MPGTFISRHRFQRKQLVSDPGMHHGTCVTHVPWCMSGSLTHGGGENVPGIPSACATRDFTYLARGPCRGLPIIKAWRIDVYNGTPILVGRQLHIAKPPMLCLSHAVPNILDDKLINSRVGTPSEAMLTVFNTLYSTYLKDLHSNTQILWDNDTQRSVQIRWFDYVYFCA